MPYIVGRRRDELNFALNQVTPHTPGELNYCITRLCLEFLNRERSRGYGCYNEIMGVLSCVQQEFYRRVVSPYENEKIKENGDVF